MILPDADSTEQAEVSLRYLRSANYISYHNFRLLC